VDYHFEASEYEKKLIQVAEMHGELIEFNEHLQKATLAKDAVIAR
jgi:sorting nexin-29